MFIKILLKNQWIIKDSIHLTSLDMEGGKNSPQKFISHQF